MGVLTLLRKAFYSFLENDCLSSGAAMAFYTVFSLPPLLAIAYFVANASGFSEEQVTRLIEQDLDLPIASGHAGEQSHPRPEGQTSSGASLPTGGLPPRLRNFGAFSKLASVLLLLISASGVFGQLQYSLNKAWKVAPDPQQGGLRDFLMKRLLSIGLVLVIGFLLLFSLLLTTFLDQFWRLAGGAIGVVPYSGILINEGFAFLLAMLLFAATFQILPDAKIHWRDVWAGSAVTAGLFVTGKALIGWYLATARIGEDWGTSAASVVGVLVWVFYSSLIVLFGAEFTHALASAKGSSIEPADGAVQVIQEKRVVRSH